MPRLPKNMIRRSDKAGFWYRRKIGGQVIVRFLGTDFDEAKRQLKRLTVEPASTLTVAQAVSRWLELYVETARAKKSQLNAQQRARDYLVPNLGHYLVERLRQDHLRGYRLALEKTKLSVQSVRHVLSDARCFLRWCEDTGLVQRSPFPRKLLPRVQEKPPDRLSAEEMASLEAMPAPYGFIARLGLGTGLRWGELARAQAADVQSGVLVVHQTKTGKVRRVPVSDSLLREIRGRVGKLVPYTVLAVGSFNHMARKLSGVQGFHAHQMRHSFACVWLEKGGSLAALQELLGHSTVVTTQRYARLSETAVLDEFRKLEQR